MEKDNLSHLCYCVMQNEDGKKLFKAIKEMLMDDPVLPKHPDVLSQFGGAEMYAAFRSGQSSLIKYIELHAKTYRDSELAKNKEANV